MRKTLLIIIGVGAFLLSAAYLFRIEILLTGISIMTDQRVQVGPNKAVEWELSLIHI